MIRLDRDVEDFGPAVALFADPFVFVCFRVSDRCFKMRIWRILLIPIGGVFPVAFITPPRNMGTYVHCTDLKTGLC